MPNSLIERENEEVQEFIKSQHRLPKLQRDQRSLDVATKKAKLYKRWLKEL